VGVGFMQWAVGLPLIAGLFGFAAAFFQGVEGVLQGVGVSGHVFYLQKSCFLETDSHALYR
jgi:hypothetical protein